MNTLTMIVLTAVVLAACAFAVWRCTRSSPTRRIPAMPNAFVKTLTTPAWERLNWSRWFSLSASSRSGITQNCLSNCCAACQHTIPTYAKSDGSPLRRCVTQDCWQNH